MSELSKLSKKILKRSFFTLVFYTISLILSIWILDKINTDDSIRELSNMTYESYDEFGYHEEPNLLIVLVIVPLMFIIVIVNYIDKILITNSYSFLRKSIFILFLSGISTEIIIYLFNLKDSQYIIFVFIFGFIVFFIYFWNAFRKKKRTEECEKLIKDIAFEPTFITKIIEFKTEKNELFPLLFQNFIFIDYYNQSFKPSGLNYFLDFIRTPIHFAVFVKRITSLRGYQINDLELTIVRIPDKTIAYKIKFSDWTTEKKNYNEGFALNDVGNIRFYKDVIEFLNEKVAFSKVV